MKSSLIHLFVALTVCVVTSIGYGLWYATIETKSAAVAQLKGEVAAKNENAKRIASARASLAEIAGSEAIIQSYFVPETGVVAFINNLEAQGRKQGTVVSVRSVSTNAEGALLTLTFSLTITGAFDAVMRTVGVIEYAPYDLSLSALSVTQDAKNSWHADLTILVGSAPAATAPTTP